MFSKISAAFNHFQGRFTYRQRFILFAIIFFLVIPLPTYWLLQTQNFLIRRAETRLTGNTFQITLGSLLNNILKHEMVALTQQRLKIRQPDLMEELENLIYLDIQKLQELAKILSPKNRNTPFTKGFSTSTAEPLVLTPIIVQWNAILNAPHTISFTEIIQMHQEVAENIFEQLKKLGYFYELFLNGSVLLQDLTNITLTILPNAQLIISKLFSLSEVYKSDPSEKNLSELLLQVGFLKSNLENMNEEVQDALERFGTENAYLPDAAINSLLNYNQSTERLLDFMDNSRSGNLSDPFISLNFANLILEALNDNELIRHLLIDSSQQILKKQRHAFLFQKYLTLLMLALATAIIMTFITFKILSSHLLKLLSQIQALGRGDFSTGAYFKDQDEFGRISQAFERIAQRMNVFTENLNALGQLVHESTLRTRQVINRQAQAIAHQANSSQNIENSAKEIAFNARSIANKMMGFTPPFELADNATNRLMHVQGEMSQLAEVSTHIVDNLKNVEFKVKYILGLINFMRELAEQTHLLSLNAAIESIPNSKIFKEITQNIDLFAAKSSGSTKDIQEIILEVSQNAKMVAQKVEIYLKEIKESGFELANVSQQLSKITQQVTDQTRHFKMIANVMVEQAGDAEKIMVSVIDVNTLSKENTQSVQALIQSIENLNESAINLNDLMNKFKTNRV